VTIAIIAVFFVFADISAVKMEPNLERRSDLAIENANQAIDNARAAYLAGDMKKTESDLNEIRESVEVSLDSLDSSGKKPRNNPHFKRAELRIGKLLRRLSGLRDEMSADDRKPVEEVAARLQEIHDHLLSEIMSKKR